MDVFSSRNSETPEAKQPGAMQRRWRMLIALAVLGLVLWYLVCAWYQLGLKRAFNITIWPFAALWLALWPLWLWSRVTEKVWLTVGIPSVLIGAWIHYSGSHSIVRDGIAAACIFLAFTFVSIRRLFGSRPAGAS